MSFSAFYPLGPLSPHLFHCLSSGFCYRYRFLVYLFSPYHLPPLNMVNKIIGLVYGLSSIFQHSFAGTFIAHGYGKANCAQCTARDKPAGKFSHVNHSSSGRWRPRAVNFLAIVFTDQRILFKLSENILYNCITKIQIPEQL